MTVHGSRFTVFLTLVATLGGLLFRCERGGKITGELIHHEGA